ncbi:MAG TPA: tRNA (guanosine(46)-N7)-methyltransferase TrmB [Nocardioidaceae bacterium]|nr:tRNA (guanosine(46)-N7)-methyltransferase TrmB [Nocardioidaceae bacterium]
MTSDRTVDERADRAPRPHTRRTADGRRLAQVTSYVRRGNRLSPRQQEVWQRRHGDWWVADEAVDDPGFHVPSLFDRPEAPLVVEIGSGNGEATAALAARYPELNILAFEVWHPGIAQTFLELERTGADNVRVIGVDAVWSLTHLVAPASVHELWTFFPDPWPKTRHHRRRLVAPEFARVAASRLEPGGLWRLATDWPEYAAVMREVLGAEPLLSNVHGGDAPRWQERPVTRFERKGHEAGRPVVDLTFRRV